MGCHYSNDNLARPGRTASGGLENARYIAAIEVKPDNPDILLAGVAPRAPDAGGGCGSDRRPPACTSREHQRRQDLDPGRQAAFPEDIQHDVITDIRYDPVAPENVIVALSSGELWISRFDRAYWCPLARQTKAARVLCAVG